MLCMQETWLIDLDGVVWKGSCPIEGGDQAIDLLRSAGKNIVFFTNNSFPTIDALVAKLSCMGIAVHVGEILTSCMAASAMLKPKSKVLCLGGPGLLEALIKDGHDVTFGHNLSMETNIFGSLKAGELFCQYGNLFSDLRLNQKDSGELLSRLTQAGNDLLQQIDSIHLETFDVSLIGLDPFFNFLTLSLGFRSVMQGSRLIATNNDMTYPMIKGSLPGGGLLLRTLESITMKDAEVAGKPYQPSVDLVLSRFGSVSYVVGDRLDTDGLLAKRLDAKFVLVYSGVTGKNHDYQPRPDFEGENLYEVVNHILNS